MASSKKSDSMGVKERRTLLGFLRDENGHYAIEFAMVAAPFLALILAIMELGLIFFAGTHLEKAVDGAARLIRTGIAQNNGYTMTEFREAIMDQSGGALFSSDKLKIDVQTETSFSAIDPTITIDEDGEIDDSEFSFDAGTCSQVVLVRVYYNWPVIAPSFGAHNIGLDLSNSGGSFRILSAIRAFQNEPYC